MRMNMSRWLSLLFRYGTLILLGLSIACLWEMGILQEYDPWGKFYALWIPLLYALCSTGYLLLNAVRPPDVQFSETTKIRHSPFRRFLSYDDYTYLFSLGFLGIIVAGPYLKNVLLWCAAAYIALIVIKAGIFLMCVAAHLRQLASPNLLPARLPRYIPLTLLLTALTIYMLISAYHIQRTTLTGDEPHYLLITHSLWHDQDTNLYNNYRDHHYKSFYWHELRPAWGDQVSETAIYSYRHKGGFPHALLPGYVLGGQFGAVLQINLITALLMLQVFLLAYELFHSLMASFLTWICMGFSIPIIIYMGQVYPETLTALLTIWAVRRIRMFHLPETLRDRHFWKNSVILGIILLSIVLLKTRYVPIAATLALFFLFHLIRQRIAFRQKFKILAIVLLFLLLIILTAFLIDMLFFDQMFLDRLLDSQYILWLLSGYNPIYGMLGGFFDQEYGLFFYTPLYMLALVGIGLLSKKEWREVFPVLTLFGLNYLAICFWPLWHAAPTPPFRYFLPVLPLLGVLLARFFLQDSRVVKSVALGVCGFWSGALAWTLTFNPWWRYNWADGTNNFLQTFSHNLGVNLPKIFPSWIRVNPAAPYLTLLGIAGIGLLIYALRFEAKRPCSLLHRFPPESQILLTVTLFLAVCCMGLALGKGLPARVMEAEDPLDASAYGGERVPASFDPWDNQLYLREWRFFGWELEPGEKLEIRPLLQQALIASSPGQRLRRQLQVYARAKLDEDTPQDFPVMAISVNGKEIGRVSVSKPYWAIYTFELVAEEKQPLITISLQECAAASCSLVLDKFRFQKL